MKSSRDENEGTRRSGRGSEDELLGDPGSELRLGRQKEEEKVRSKKHEENRVYQESLILSRKSGKA